MFINKRALKLSTMRSVKFRMRISIIYKNVEIRETKVDVLQIPAPAMISLGTPATLLANIANKPSIGTRCLAFGKCPL